MSSPPPLTPLAAAALHAGRPERILQIECGEGDGALFLAREFPRASVRGVDREEAAIRRASARVGLDPEGRVAFKQGPPGSLPFPDDLFDLVALLDAEPAPREALRVLRPGGRLLLAHSDRAAVPTGPAARLRAWRLRRGGVETLIAEDAGAGSFSVGVLRPAGQVGRCD